MANTQKLKITASVDIRRAGIDFKAGAAKPFDIGTLSDAKRAQLESVDELTIEVVEPKATAKKAKDKETQ